jgi:thioredoxin 1
MTTQSTTDATFDADVRQSDIPVVVDFWAPWCGPCKAISGSLEQIAAEMSGKVKIIKVDIDQNPNIAAQLGIRGIPALFLFKDGQIVANKAGSAPKGVLEKWIKDAL